MKIIDKLPKKIDAVVFDFDGVFTNNAVYLSEKGIEIVRCDRSDDSAFHITSTQSKCTGQATCCYRYPVWDYRGRKACGPRVCPVRGSSPGISR